MVIDNDPHFLAIDIIGHLTHIASLAYQIPQSGIIDSFMVQFLLNLLLINIALKIIKFLLLLTNRLHRI